MDLPDMRTLTRYTDNPLKIYQSICAKKDIFHMKAVTWESYSIDKRRLFFLQKPTSIEPLPS